MFSKFFNSLFGRKPKSKVSITNFNLKFMGGMHSLKGIDVSSEVFEYSLPFENKMGSSLLPDDLVGPSTKIIGITVDEPFKLIEASPKLPVEVPYMSKMKFRMKIRAPKVAYTGPLSITLENDSSDNIAINVQKVVLMHDEKLVPLENSEMITTMQKSQLFRKDIQLYKIISLNDIVHTIAVGKPFELVAVDPKLPITADKRDSYIVSLYLKAPTFSYSGNIEIRLS